MKSVVVGPVTESDPTGLARITLSRQAGLGGTADVGSLEQRT